MGTQEVTPVFGINPDDAVARVAKMVIQARDALDTVFSVSPNFSENNPDIFAQVLQIMHGDYVEAVRSAQRADEVRKP